MEPSTDEKSKRARKSAKHNHHGSSSAPKVKTSSELQQAAVESAAARATRTSSQSKSASPATAVNGKASGCSTGRKTTGGSKSADKTTKVATTSTSTPRPATSIKGHGQSKSGRNTTRSVSGSCAGEAADAAVKKELLLSARHHHQRGSVSSIAELPLTPTHGDIHTMVCDVSPVPSDVESIDYFGTPGQETGRQRLVHIGRPVPQIRIRSGRVNEDTASAPGVGLFSAFSRSRQSQTKTSGVPRTMAASTEGATSTNRQRTTITKPDLGDTANNSITDVTCGQTDEKRDQPVLKSTNASSLSSNSQRGPTIMKPSTQRTPSSETKSNHSTSNKIKPIVKPDENCLTSSSSNQNKTNTITNTKNSVSKAYVKQSENENMQREEFAEPIIPNLNVTTNNAEIECDLNEIQLSKIYLTEENQLPETGEDMTIVNENIVADDECRKAYAILNCKGIKVSLKTLRRALLTPTECRLLMTKAREPEMKNETIRLQTETTANSVAK